MPAFGPIRRSDLVEQLERMMWVQRTPEEVARWDAITRRDARRHGLGIAGISCVGGVVFVAGGLLYTRAGVIHHHVAGSFWVRLPILAALTAPFAYWFSRHEMRKELAKAYRRTICPTCDIAGDGNAGQACRCGDTFVAQCSMKWVDDP